MGRVHASQRLSGAWEAVELGEERSRRGSNSLSELDTLLRAATQSVRTNLAQNQHKPTLACGVFRHCQPAQARTTQCGRLKQSPGMGVAHALCLSARCDVLACATWALGAWAEATRVGWRALGRAAHCGQPNLPSSTRCANLCLVHPCLPLPLVHLATPLCCRGHHCQKACPCWSGSMCSGKCPSCGKTRCRLGCGACFCFGELLLVH